MTRRVKRPRGKTKPAANRSDNRSRGLLGRKRSEHLKALLVGTDAYLSRFSVARPEVDFDARFSVSSARPPLKKLISRRNPHNRALVPDPIRAAERSSARRTDPEAVRVSGKKKSGVRSRQKQALPDIAATGVRSHSEEISPVAQLNRRLSVEARLSRLEAFLGALDVRIIALIARVSSLLGHREAA